MSYGTEFIQKWADFPNSDHMIWKKNYQFLQNLGELIIYRKILFCSPVTGKKVFSGMKIFCRFPLYLLLIFTNFSFPAFLRNNSNILSTIFKKLLDFNFNYVTSEKYADASYFSHNIDVRLVDLGVTTNHLGLWGQKITRNKWISELVLQGVILDPVEKIEASNFNIWIIISVWGNGIVPHCVMLTSRWFRLI